MRKLILALFMLAPLVLMAQVSNPGVLYVSVAPSGACSAFALAEFVIPAGTLYTCQSGTWGQIASSSGTVTSVTASGFLASSGGSTPNITVAHAQGTDTNLLTAGIITGTSASLCTDANGGATTFSCPGPIVTTGQGITTTSSAITTTGVTTSQIPFNNPNALTPLMQIAVIPTSFPYTIPTNGLISGSTTLRNATSQLYLGTLPTSTWVMTLYKYASATAGCLTSSPTSLGTVSIATSGAQTWSISQISFAIGDCLVLTAPSSVDASAASPYGAIAVVD